MYRILTALALCLPLPAAAHPHVFIDTGLDLVFDDKDRLTHVRVTWVYDAFYSLLLLEDQGLDADADGVLTAEEQTRLTGFDMNWIEGYNGDLDVRLDDTPLSLSGPMEPTAEVEDGRIVSTHLRAVEDPQLTVGRVLSVKAYDETYYTAYDLVRPVTLTGATSCLLERIDPDIDGRLAQMQAMLLSMDANADLEENDIPLVGAEFATEIRVSCAGS